MRSNNGIVGLSHSCDDATFCNSTCMTQIRLQNAGGTLLQDFAESPFCEDALAGSDGEVGAACDVDKNIDVLGLAGVLNEHRLIGLELFIENVCRLRWNCVVEVGPDVARFLIVFTQ